MREWRNKEWPRLDWLQGVEEKSNSESRCFESDFLERKFYLPLSGVRKLLSPHLVERHGNWLTSRPRWPSIGSSLWCPRAGLGLVYLLPVLHPGPAGWKNGPTPFFLCTLDIPLSIPGRPQRSLAKLWNAIKDVEWVALRRQKPDLHELVLLPRRCTCRPDAWIISLQCLSFVFLIWQQFASLRKVFFQQIKIFCQIFSCTQKNWHNSVFFTNWLVLVN